MTSIDSQLSNIPHIPKCLQDKTFIQSIKSFNESQNELFSYYRTAAHVFIWAPWEGASVFGVFKAAIMMQLRFDGSFGFPGGLIDRNEDVLVGLNRELKEEIGWDIRKHKVTWQHYYNTRVDEKRGFIFHFFIISLDYPIFVELEKNAHTGKDYRTEVFGIVRVPLYTMTNEGGLPTFLNNKFVDVAKHQLLLALYHTNLFTEDELKEVLQSSENKRLTSRF